MIKINIVLLKKMFMVIKILENIWKIEEYYVYSFVHISNNKKWSPKLWLYYFKILDLLR